MYKRPMLPHDYTAPLRCQGDGFHLRMLSVQDVVKDYAAVLDSEARLVGFMDPAATWPRGLTIEENLIDLGWHQREFTLGHSFAYTVMTADESRCLGCCYIYPSERRDYDAVAFYWARAAGFDDTLGKTFRAFLRASWPFRAVAFPGRDIAWGDWNDRSATSDTSASRL